MRIFTSAIALLTVLTGPSLVSALVDPKAAQLCYTTAETLERVVAEADHRLGQCTCDGGQTHMNVFDSAVSLLSLIKEVLMEKHELPAQSSKTSRDYRKELKGMITAYMNRHPKVVEPPPASGGAGAAVRGGAEAIVNFGRKHRHHRRNPHRRNRMRHYQHYHQRPPMMGVMVQPPYPNMMMNGNMRGNMHGNMNSNMNGNFHPLVHPNFDHAEFEEAPKSHGDCSCRSGNAYSGQQRQLLVDINSVWGNDICPKRSGFVFNRRTGRCERVARYKWRDTGAAAA